MVCNKLAEDLSSNTNKIKELQIELDEAQNYKKLYEEMRMVVEEGNTVEVTVEIKLDLLQGTRIIIVGGNDTWQQNMTKWCEDRNINNRAVRVNDTTNLPLLNPRDLVILNLRSTSHSSTYKVIETIKNKKAILYRTFTVDVDQVMKGAYITYTKHWL